MIHFFRRIRQSLLADSKYRKYLFYAIGEIALVMIGILLALQVNNWNERNTQDRELQEYLLKIADNMEQDFDMAQEYTLRRDSLRLASQLAVQSIDNKTYDFDILSRGAACFVEFYFIANKSGFEALKNSGYLGKIKNSEINDLLHEYYAIVNEIEKVEEGYNAFIENMEVDFNRDYPAIAFKKEVYKEHFSFLKEEQRPKQFYNYFESYAYQAAFARTVQQTDSQILYQELIEVGKLFIKELNLRERS